MEKKSRTGVQRSDAVCLSSIILRAQPVSECDQPEIRGLGAFANLGSRGGEATLAKNPLAAGGTLLCT